MVDYIALGADIAIVVITSIGTYYAFVASTLFKGDVIMERVWRLATTAFAIVAFFSVIDFGLTAANSSLVGLHLVRIAAVIAIGIFVVAVMLLTRWGRSTIEPRNPAITTASSTLIVGWEGRVSALACHFLAVP
jgi:hypothetical protein